MKPAKSLDKMIGLMESRGLTVPDYDEMRRILFDSNYYRLSGYFRAFQNDPAHGDNNFKSGVAATDFLEPYRLDGELRTSLVANIRAMVYLHNLCSHHGRLWHREMVIVPPVTRDMRRQYPNFDYEQKSVAQALIALFYLADEINGNDSYSDGLIDFLSKHHHYDDGIHHPLHWE